MAELDEIMKAFNGMNSTEQKRMWWEGIGLYRHYIVRCLGADVAEKILDVMDYYTNDILMAIRPYAIVINKFINSATKRLLVKDMYTSEDVVNCFHVSVEELQECYQRIVGVLNECKTDMAVSNMLGSLLLCDVTSEVMLLLILEATILPVYTVLDVEVLLEDETSTHTIYDSSEIRDILRKAISLHRAARDW